MSPRGPRRALVAAFAARATATVGTTAACMASVAGALGMVGLTGSVGCTPPRTAATTPATTIPADAGAAGVAVFARIEDEALAWFVAADPRLAARAGMVGPDEVLKRIGLDAALDEDPTARIAGGTLDLFAFRARARTLDEAAHRAAAFTGRLPDAAPAGFAICRPGLEAELLVRTIAEERARTAEEALLGEASGDLVRAVVALWTPPADPQDQANRDAWLQEHLLQVRDSLREGRVRTGPMDLDAALYPLERMLLPLAYPKGAAAIAAVRLALDADMRTVPALLSPERLAREARVHLGVSLDAAAVSALPSRFAPLEATLRQRVAAAAGPARETTEARARGLLLVERPCPPVLGSRVRSFAPPPERATICGALRALGEEPDRAAALMALHDDVVLAEAAVTLSPAPRTALLSHPDDDVVDALRRRSRERPVPAVGVILAAELLYGGDAARAEARLAAWRALGDAPLDVVARELDSAR